jgi:DNA-binding XRE family transcriptional regulator
MSLAIKRAALAGNITHVEISSTQLRLDLRITARLSPRARRTIAVEFVRQIRPILNWIRHSEIHHWDVHDMNLPRMERRGFPIPRGMGIDDRLGALGFEIRYHRLKIGMSQEQLAVRAGVSRPTLSKIERGLESPRKCTLEALRSALQMPFDRKLPPF